MERKEGNEQSFERKSNISFERFFDQTKGALSALKETVEGVFQGEKKKKIRDVVVASILTGALAATPDTSYAYDTQLGFETYNDFSSEIQNKPEERNISQPSKKGSHEEVQAFDLEQKPSTQDDSSSLGTQDTAFEYIQDTIDSITPSDVVEFGLGHVPVISEVMLASKIPQFFQYKTDIQDAIKTLEGIVKDGVKETITHYADDVRAVFEISLVPQNHRENIVAKDYKTLVQNIENEKKNVLGEVFHGIDLVNLDSLALMDQFYPEIATKHKALKILLEEDGYVRFDNGKIFRVEKKNDIPSRGYASYEDFQKVTAER